ncbi:MAG: methyl-accepting chemotaxis protein [candidate division Zixibacteria bacterium]|nr:methyl-accepting chemotaxis protein [candidate division Zixibacteria bacterium]MDH3938989.1 methyl-accepting chemotaxis protein [candidate division Zixibacteria bacterium]MDH4032398.1 methyl-accepting chemotaxis protein [candidate division Zixibacteria bacterium]
MNILNIRNQILGTGLVSLVVLVGVIAYFYGFAKSEFTGSSQDLVGLINQRFADEMDRGFATDAKTFNDWTKDDVFGIAIEFSTTKELTGEFERWLMNAPGFSLIVLVDQAGVVLEATGSSALSTSASTLAGSALSDYAWAGRQTKKRSTFGTSTVLANLGSDATKTWSFYCPSYSSSGERNGALVAFTDWSKTQAQVRRCTEALADKGYSSARSAIIFPGQSGSLASYESANSESASQDETSMLTTWADNAAGFAVNTGSISGEDVFVGQSPLSGPTLSDDDVSATGPVLLTVVPEEEVMAQLNSQLIKILLLSMLGTVLLIGINYFIARRISRRITLGSEIAETMAAGDVNQTIEIHGNDELGALGASFAKLAAYMKEMSTASERIADGDLTVSVQPKSETDLLGNSFKKMGLNLTIMIRQLTESAGEVVSAATEISASSAQMSQGAKQQTDQIDQVSTAIEEMTATIVESSKNAGEASEGAKSASETADTGGEVVGKTIDGMQRIAGVVRESAESISRLASSVDQIGEIIGVIDDIADQTNLLALNAAIEAARAGEQGRGFAVVADEVRKLAERTGTATGEITGMIKGIQSETDQAVNSMEAGIQEVDKGKELADKAGNSLNEIVSMSQQVMRMINQIADAALEQSTAAEEIAKSVEDVSSIAKETAGGADQSASVAEQLSRQADHLKSMVAKFKVEH